jgi:hypothetical protein
VIRGRGIVALALALGACGQGRAPRPRAASADDARDAAVADAAPPDAAPPDAAPPDAAPSDAGPDAAPAQVRTSVAGWQQGSTHVHAKASGDATLPVPDVMRWYEDRGYDFIVLTDHNRVTEVDGHSKGVAVHAPAQGLIVLAGIELTFNRNHCTDHPPPPGDPKCRIHVNALGVTKRPHGKLTWDTRQGKSRAAGYRAALALAASLGGLAQINHPQWHWGMTAALLIALAQRGPLLFEITNRQFAIWNAGDADHPSTEALWDAALTAGQTVWGVASDDAHDYDGGGKYPAGRAYVVVRAAHDARAIKAALAAGQFYASTGVALDRAEVDHGALVIEVSAADPGDHAIVFIGAGGRVLRTDHGRSARFSLADLPGDGYVRAVITRTDGGKAWSQPARP